MTTCFTRIVIVLGFIRQAIGTQNMPPTQIIIGLSPFLSFFIMSPTLNTINDKALQPYMKEDDHPASRPWSRPLAPCANSCSPR